MNIAELLVQTADVLEKSAAYLEGIETVRINTETEVRTKKANALAERIASAVGEPVDSSLVDKLAGTSPEVQALLGRLAGGDIVDSLGGPHVETKTAAVNGVSPEDDRFLSWLQS